jgi:hypothetical protein
MPPRGIALATFLDLFFRCRPSVAIAEEFEASLALRHCRQARSAGLRRFNRASQGATYHAAQLAPGRAR